MTSNPQNTMPGNIGGIFRWHKIFPWKFKHKLLRASTNFSQKPRVKCVNLFIFYRVMLPKFFQLSKSSENSVIICWNKFGWIFLLNLYIFCMFRFCFTSAILWCVLFWFTKRTRCYRGHWIWQILQRNSQNLTSIFDVLAMHFTKSTMDSYIGSTL